MNENNESLLLNIEEEDLILLNNSNIVYNNSEATVYLAEYHDIKVNFVIFADEEIMNREILYRIKYNSSYLPYLLGVCNYSSIGIGLVFEHIDGSTLHNIVYSNETQVEKKIDIIGNLLSLFDFNNSRGLLFTNITLDEIVLDMNNKLRINKYPITSSIETYDDLLNRRNEDILQLSPDMITNAKESNKIEAAVEQESWLLGCLIYEILESKTFINISNELLFYKDADVLTLNKISTEKIIQIDNKQINNLINNLPYNQYIKNILKKLLKIDKKQRVIPKLIRQMFVKNKVMDNIYTPKAKCKIFLKLDYTINESCINIESSVFDISKDLNFNTLMNNESMIPLKRKPFSRPNENEHEEDFSKKEQSKTERITLFNNNNATETNQENDTHVSKNEVKLITLPIIVDSPNSADLKEDESIKLQFINLGNVDKVENTDLIEMDNHNDVEGEVAISNVDLLINDGVQKSIRKDSEVKRSAEILKELFHHDQTKSYIKRLEQLAREYVNTSNENYLAELKDVILKKDINNQELEIYGNITSTLWETIMCLAFELLESDDIKNHYIITNILYATVDKCKANNPKNIATAKFHYAMSMKDYCNNYSLSLNLFIESIKLIEKEGEGDTHLGVQIKYYLGNLYDDMGMSEESIELLREVLEKQIKLFTEQHIYTARTYNCLGIAEDNRGNLKPAKDYYQRSYGIFKYLSCGLETIDSVKVLNNLAGIYYKWEDFSNCIKYYLTVLDVYKSKYGEANSNMGITYNNLSNCYAMLDNNDKALFYLKQAVEIFNTAFGSSHIQTAMAHKNLGDLYLNLEDKKNALDMFTKCVDIFLEKFGEDNDMYISTISKIRKIKSTNI
jgi:tetratricopeptide (TPR) repeat protein